MRYDLKLKFEKFFDFAKRNIPLIMLGVGAFLLYGAASSSMQIILLLVLIEAVALALSGIAAYSFTKVDFIRQQMYSTLGSIFLGVHICIGLVVMGAYFTMI